MWQRFGNRISLFTRKELSDFQGSQVALFLYLQYPLSRPCRYRPYPKAGRTVEPQPFALGKPFLPKMPDGSRRGNWKANAPPARSGSFRSASGDICRLPYRGTVLKDVCAIQIEKIGLGGIFAIWHPLIQRGNVYASASPRLRQALRASSSGVS